MANVSLVLGPVVFKDFEIPPDIAFGGSQRVAVHELLGGTRILDTMGRADATIRFSGVFCGSDATLRARMLNELRAAGVMLPLTWDVFLYTVVISEFQAIYQNTGWIAYKIACTVVRDEASAFIQPAISLAASTMADAITAGSQAILAGVDVTGSQAALAASGATTRGTSAYLAAQTAVSTDQASIATGLGIAQSTLGGAASITPPVDTDAASASIAQLNGATAAAQTTSILTVAKAYLGRVAANLNNAST